MPLVSFDFSPSFQRTIIPVDLHINSVVTIGSRKTEEINVLKTIFFFYGLGGSYDKSNQNISPLRQDANEYLMYMENTTLLGRKSQLAAASNVGNINGLSI
jgi:hypothetical protein